MIAGTVNIEVIHAAANLLAEVSHACGPHVISIRGRQGGSSFACDGVEGGVYTQKFDEKIEDQNAPSPKKNLENLGVGE